MLDLRYTLRTLLRRPGFTAIVVLTLALGIAANTTVFSIVSALLLRPLPGIHDPSRLVSLYRVQNGQTFDNLGYPDYRDYSNRIQSLSGLAAHSAVALSFNAGSPERVIGDLVTPNYFDVLRVRPAAGRLLAEDDDSAAVLGYALWQRKFGGNPNAIGAKIQLNGYPFTIAGVTEQGFHGTELSLPFELWVPLRTLPRMQSHLSADIFENRSAGWLSLFGRLKPGVELRQANAEIATVASGLARAYPVTNGKRTAVAAAGVGMYPDDRAEICGLLALLAGAVALLLAIACANAAGMLLLRALNRTREIAIRLATGAPRKRIVSQLLAEGCILALLAGSLGVLLAVWAIQANSNAPSLIGRANAGINRTVLLFTLLATLITGLVVALLPAIQSLKVDLTDALKSGLPGSGFRGTRLRSTLVAGQVALSLVLLSGAGVLLRGLHRIVTGNPGFDANNVAMASLDLSLERYSEDRGQAFYRSLLTRLTATPGVLSATLASSVPPTEWPGAVSIFHPGQEPPPEILQGREFELGLRVNINHIAPNYFQTLRIPLLKGRDFTDRDRAGAPGVVIVSRSLAEKMWPGENPIGQWIAYPSWNGPRRPPFEVVGVAGDVRHLALTSDAPPLLYVPISQEYDGRMRVVVRTATGFSPIHQAVAAIDKQIALYAPETGPEHSAASLWQQRMAATWIGAFSAMALLLAAVGLYAVIAQSVAQRTRDLGIRMALGANGSSIAALVLKQGALLGLAGIAVGAPAGLGFNLLVSQRLAGISAADPIAFASIAILLLLVILAASWIPARRAMRVDPMQALRSD
ncbi:MAG TPA: ABC transporter permease [Bryobacteraceae bacterium]|nr:ABC transporter permease [Bryobacteraceae bacterium]